MNILKNKAIQVNIDCDIATKEVCKIVAESLLKYVLYQFNQIPVQIDVLEKELAKGEFVPELSEAVKNENQQSEDSIDSTDPRSYFRQKGLQKRAELANRMRARKRKMWLIKVDKLVNNFKNTIKILENEINNAAVKTIIYSVGTTPITPKFVFKMHIPQHLNSTYHSSHKTTSSSILKRKILSNMLRAFANNADILKFTSSHFSVSKLWTLFEKESSSEVGENQNSSDITLRPEFSISTRTKCIEIYFNEQNLSNMSMELTPCVNTHPTKSFIVSVENRHKSFTNEDISEEKESELEDLNLDFKPLEYDDPHGDIIVKSIFTKPSSFIKTNNLLNGEAIKCTTIQTPFRNTDRDIILTKTPFNQNNNDFDSMVETPVIPNTISTPSPVKRLTNNITKLKFTPTKLEYRQFNWFQIDSSLNGFKDMC
ncbi:hypothetical protein Anas_05038 [Armadillidium nasatum]|uniref:Uncharacterized protein n=1 Tax=Armadillidium nasatum TaxID=96803 RepID=A0A5N5THK3_9CRUS|nr:hypothetical protein Anas_05038 [Armadillidium nasatum]